MLTNETVAKLREMHLNAMAEGFSAQLLDRNYSELSFEERFSMLVDSEWSRRKANRVKSLMKKAGYSESGACLEDLTYTPERNLDRAQILRLSTCSFMEEHNNVVILGATGTGKTYLSCALGIAANRKYYTTRYIRLPDLLVEIALARGDGSYRDVMKEYRSCKLLILDDWLLYPLKESEARDVLEIVEARKGSQSTIFCSQFDVPGWHEFLGEPTLADAVCDRIANTSYIITLKGKSLRRLNAAKD